MMSDVPRSGAGDDTDMSSARGAERRLDARAYNGVYNSYGGAREDDPERAASSRSSRQRRYGSDERYYGRRGAIVREGPDQADQAPVFEAAQPRGEPFWGGGFLRRDGSLQQRRLRPPIDVARSGGSCLRYLPSIFSPPGPRSMCTPWADGGPDRADSPVRRRRPPARRSQDKARCCESRRIPLDAIACVAKANLSGPAIRVAANDLVFSLPRP